MKTVTLLVVCLIGYACSTKQSLEDRGTQDTTKTNVTPIADSTTRQEVGISPSEARKLLQGIWAADEDSNALFQIKGDSLYYFEDPDPVYFEVRKDSFKVLIEGRFFSSKILKLDADSLIRIEYKKVVKLYKRK